jgi:hypothetical protein
MGLPRAHSGQEVKADGGAGRPGEGYGLWCPVLVISRTDPTAARVMPIISGSSNRPAPVADALVTICKKVGMKQTISLHHRLAGWCS